MRTESDQRKLEKSNKLIQKSLKTDIRSHNTKIITETIKEHQGPKVLKRKLTSNKSEINKLTNKTGTIVTDPDEDMYK